MTPARFQGRERCVCVSCTEFAKQGENVLDTNQAEEIIIHTSVLITALFRSTMNDNSTKENTVCF